MMKKQYKPSIKLSHQKLMSTKTHWSLSSCTSRRKLSTRLAAVHSLAARYFILSKILRFFFFTSIDAISDKVNRLLLNHNMVAREQNNMYIVHVSGDFCFEILDTKHSPPTTNKSTYRNCFSIRFTWSGKHLCANLPCLISMNVETQTRWIFFFPILTFITRAVTSS